MVLASGTSTCPVLLRIWICFVCSERHAFWTTFRWGYSESQEDYSVPLRTAGGQRVRTAAHRSSGLVGLMKSASLSSPSLQSEGIRDWTWTESSGPLSQQFHQQKRCRWVNTPAPETATPMRRPGFWTLSWYLEASPYFSSLGEKELWRTDGWVFSRSSLVYV